MKRIEGKLSLLKKKLRLRVSRTSGVNTAYHPIKGATLNPRYGLRVSKSFKGLLLGFQGKNAVFRGRWDFLNGLLNVNLAKSGLSLSSRTKFGTLNWSKPQYSSFSLLGIQLRGKKAFQYALIGLLIFIAYSAFLLTLKLVIWLTIFFVQLFFQVLMITYRLLELLTHVVIYVIARLYVAFMRMREEESKQRS